MKLATTEPLRAAAYRAFRTDLTRGRFCPPLQVLSSVPAHNANQGTTGGYGQRNLNHPPRRHMPYLPTSVNLLKPAVHYIGAVWLAAQSDPIQPNPDDAIALAQTCPPFPKLVPQPRPVARQPLPPWLFPSQA